jgi:hypothetical protein
MSKNPQEAHLTRDVLRVLIRVIMLLASVVLPFVLFVLIPIFQQ